jgi:hypothetical protein
LIVRSPPHRRPILEVSNNRTRWAAGPLNRLARALNIPTVVDDYDVLLAVVA